MAETMYCPRCATEVTDEVGFCRNCGLRLSGLTEFLGNEPLTPARQRRPNRRIMSAGMTICILALVIALTNAALAPWIGIPESYGKSLFLLMFGIGLAFVGLGVVLPQKQRPRSGSQAQTDGRQRPSGVATNQLPRLHDPQATVDAPFEPREKVPSVTENTTRNLS